MTFLISLVLLPQYASDFPSSDKRQYNKLLFKWASVVQELAKKVSKDILTTEQENADGGVLYYESKLV